MNPTNVNVSLDSFIKMLKMGETKVAFGTETAQGVQYFAKVNIGKDEYLAAVSCDPFREHPAHVIRGNQQQHTWQRQGDELRVTVTNKLDLVEALTKLGVSSEQLKAIKTSKVSQLRELIGEVPEDKDTLEVISQKLTTKRDAVKFAIENKKATLGLYDGVEVKVSENYGSQLNYTITLDIGKAYRAEEAAIKREIEGLGVVILNGTNPNYRY